MRIVCGMPETRARGVPRNTLVASRPGLTGNKDWRLHKMPMPRNEDLRPLGESATHGSLHPENRRPCLSVRRRDDEEEEEEEEKGETLVVCN